MSQDLVKNGFVVLRISQKWISSCNMGLTTEGPADDSTCGEVTVLLRLGEDDIGSVKVFIALMWHSYFNMASRVTVFDINGNLSSP